MAKKCIICGNQAEFCIKGSSECYCPECAEEQFGDLDMLIKIDEAVKVSAADATDVAEDLVDLEEDQS